MTTANPYDTAFRFNQALDPSALVKFSSALHAVQAAVQDCMNAGIAPDTDPAVMLLARHLASFAGSDDLACSRHTRECLASLADLRGKSRLAVLAQRGVAHDSAAKQAFHREARTALRALADALGLDDDSYDLRSNMGGVAVSGEIMLHSDDLYVQISICTYERRGQLMFRSCTARDDYCGGRNYAAPFKLLLAPDKLAAKIQQALGLPVRRTRLAA